MKNERVFLYLILMLVSARARGESITHWGVAKNNSGSIVYTERHTISSADGVLKSSETDYYDSDRRTKISRLNSDYSRSLSMPTYEFRDFRTNYREGLRYANGKYIAYYHKPNEEEKSKKLNDVKSIFSCQGWHYYLIENLKVLERQDIAINLVMPSELDFYSFTIKKSATNENMIVANLELTNWVLSFFAPKLMLVYDKNLKKLIEYRGVSNILDKDGNRQEVTIHYEYNDLDEGNR